MHKLKRISTLAIALLAVAVFSGSASALAHGGNDDTGENQNVANSTSAQSPSLETEHTISPEKKAEFRQKANDDVNKKLSENQEKHAKNSEERHKKCEAHKQGLNTKFDRIITKSQKHQDRIDNILNKATAYKTTNNLSPANWDDLLSAAQAAQNTSAKSIADLQNIKPSIDCNSDSVATDVATFKAAAATARDNLKAYKTSVKALLTALKEAKPTTEGNTQ